MSKKPVNFYQGAKGTFRIDIVEKTISGLGQPITIIKATHTYEEIKQAIGDGFIPYCVRESGITFYYFLNSYSATNMIFIGETEDIIINDSNIVRINDKSSGGSGEDYIPDFILTVHFDPDAGDQGKYGTPDKTFAEVDAAMQAGKPVVLRIDNGNNYYRYISGYGYYAMPGLIEFKEVYWGFGNNSPVNMSYSAFRYNSDNEFTEYRKDVFIAYTE